jgi:hypothetical protein
MEEIRNAINLSVEAAWNTCTHLHKWEDYKYYRDHKHIKCEFMGWINLARNAVGLFFCENSELDVGSIVVREFFAYLKAISFPKNNSAR